MEFYKKSINGNEIQIADYPGEKGPIVAIHGLTNTHKSMHYYAENFKSEYRFISIDLRGRGNSDNADEDTSIYRHAEDVIELLKELNIEDSILMGHSIGGFISAIVANKLDTIKAIILLDSLGQSKKDSDGVEDAGLTLGRLDKKYSSKEEYIAESKNRFSNLGIKWTEVLQENVEYEVEEEEQHWKNKSTKSRILADLQSINEINLKDQVSNINCPMLLIYAKDKIGKGGPMFSLGDFDETLAYAKDLEFIVCNCNHHTLVFENRPEIYKKIKLFLEGI